MREYSGLVSWTWVLPAAAMISVFSFVFGLTVTSANSAVAQTAADGEFFNHAATLLDGEVTDDDNVGYVERAILEFFNGIGYRYTGSGIVYDEEWVEDEG